MNKEQHSLTEIVKAFAAQEIETSISVAENSQLVLTVPFTSGSVSATVSFREDAATGEVSVTMPLLSAQYAVKERIPEALAAMNEQLDWCECTVQNDRFTVAARLPGDTPEMGEAALALVKRMAGASARLIADFMSRVGVGFLSQVVFTAEEEHEEEGEEEIDPAVPTSAAPWKGFLVDEVEEKLKLLFQEVEVPAFASYTDEHRDDPDMWDDRTDIRTFYNADGKEIMRFDAWCTWDTEKVTVKIYGCFEGHMISPKNLWKWTEPWRFKIMKEWVRRSTPGTLDLIRGCNEYYDKDCNLINKVEYDKW